MAPPNELKYGSADWYKLQFPGFPDARIYEILQEATLSDKTPKQLKNIVKKQCRKSASQSKGVQK